MDKNDQATMEAAADIVVTETTKQVGKIKGFFSKLKEQLASAKDGVKSALSNDNAADGIMRWPRPVAFFLLLAMFLSGWFNPATLMAFAQAIAILPESFWTIVYIVLGSIGASKLSNDIIKVITSRK